MPKQIITSSSAPIVGITPGQDVSPLAQAVRFGNMLFVSGQGAVDPVTGTVIEGDIAAQTRLTLDNLMSILGAAGATAENIVNMRVSLRDTATNTVTQLVADAAGNYVATPLRIGVYAVSVELPGFKKQTREGIVLRVQDRLRIDFDLEPGAVAETVVVTGEAPLVQSETSSLGEVVDARQIVGLPLNGRTRTRARCSRSPQPGRAVRGRHGRRSRHGGSAAP